MTQRRLHPAPPDYGIIELLADDQKAGSVFVVYRHGMEMARARTPHAAWALADADRSGRPRVAILDSHAA